MRLENAADDEPRAIIMEHYSRLFDKDELKHNVTTLHVIGSDDLPQSAEEDYDARSTQARIELLRSHLRGGRGLLRVRGESQQLRES